MMEKLREVLKKYRFAALVALAGIVLMVLPGGKKDGGSEESCAQDGGFSLEETEKRMADMGVKLEADDAAVAELAKEGFDPKYGARPLRRAIQSKVEDAVAEKMLDGTLKTGDTAKLAVEDDKLVVTK